MEQLVKLALLLVHFRLGLVGCLDQNGKFGGTGSTFNRNYTGVYFDPWLFRWNNGLPNNLNESGLTVLANKIETEFHNILVPLYVEVSENDLVPEILALQNHHHHQQNKTSATPPIRLTIRYTHVKDWQDDKNPSRLQRIRHALDKANAIFPGTVNTVILDVKTPTNRSLQQYFEFTRFFNGDGNGPKYQLGLRLDIKHCKVSSSGWESIRLGFPDKLYFSQAINTQNTPGSVGGYLDVFTKYFENCKRLVKSVNPRTEVGFISTWPDTGLEGHVQYSNLVKFWRSMDHWAGKTKTEIFFFQAFDTPLHPDLTMKMNGWWRLLPPNSSYSQFTFEAKSSLRDDAPPKPVNLTWLGESSDFSRVFTGVIFNPVVLKRDILLGNQNPFALFRNTELIKQIGTQFSKILISAVGKSQDMESQLASVPNVIANLNLNESVMGSPKILELIMVVGQTNVKTMLGLANGANKLFPGTIKTLIFRPLYGNNSDLGQTGSSIKSLQSVDGMAAYQLGIVVPLGKCYEDPQQFQALLTLFRDAGGINMIYFNAPVPLVLSKLGFERVLSQLTVMFRNCKDRLLQIVPNSEVTFVTSWPSPGGEENIEDLIQSARFWEGMNDWAGKTNNSVIFSEAFDSPTSVEVEASGRKLASPRYGWWKLTERGTFTGTGEEFIFENKKEVALRLVLEESSAKETAATTTSRILEASVISLTFILLLFVILYLRRRQSNNLSEADIKDFFKGGVVAHHHQDLEGFPPTNPSINGPYNKANYEILKRSFTIYESSSLGSGEFGAVCRGTVRKDDGGGGVLEEDVAIKLVKDPTKQAALRSLLFEIKILSYLGNHPNVVEMKGAYTAELRSGKVYIFLELCSLGSLKSYINRLNGPRSRGKWEESLKNDMLRWSKEIASGMEYIASKNIVHMDIATRNILLSSDKVAKITDFGLSRRMYNYQSYTKQHQEPLPWRSMAPESLRKLEFTEKSDVWAFGITLWEIFSLGDEPYPGLAWDVDFPSMLEGGLRLNAPRFNPNDIYSVMVDCWNTDPEERPTFSELALKLAYNSNETGSLTGRYMNLSSGLITPSAYQNSLKRATLLISDLDQKGKPEGNQIMSNPKVTGSQQNSWRYSLPCRLGCISISLIIFLLVIIVSVLTLYILHRHGLLLGDNNKVAAVVGFGSGGDSDAELESSNLDADMKNASSSSTTETNNTTIQHAQSGVDHRQFPEENGNTKLHSAVALEDENLVIELVQDRADVINAQNKKMQTPLHIAASIPNLAIMKILIENKADVIAKDWGNLTFLHQLVEEGSTLDPSRFHEMTNYLVERNLTRLFNIPGGKHDATPLQMAIGNEEVAPATLSILHKNLVDFSALDKEGCSLLCYAVKGIKGVDFLSMLIQRFDSDWRQLDSHNRNLVHIAAEFGNWPALEFFAALGFGIRAPDMNGDTPLHRVIVFGKDNVLEVIRYLVEKGADVNAVNELQRTLLHQVAYNDLDMEVNLKIVRYLIDNKADVFAQDKMDQVFLHPLFLENNSSLTLPQFEDLSKYLVDKGYSKVFDVQGGTDGSTPFQLALKSFELDEATLSLLHKNGVNFNANDKNGLSLLGYALEGRRSTSFLSKLLQFHGEGKTLKKDNSSELLHVAAQVGNLEALDFFLKMGININTADPNGNTPLHRVGQSGKENILEVIRYLVENGGNVNSINKKQETPLFALSQNDIIDMETKLKTIKYLIDSGSNVVRRSKFNPTFLHNLVKSQLTPDQFHDITEYLVGKGYSQLFDVPNADDGATSLLLAVKNVEVDYVTLTLLNKHDVNFKAVDRYGRSILNYGVEGRKRINLLSYLIGLGAEMEHLDADNNTLLHTAASIGNMEALKFLHELGVIFIDSKNKLGWTPLHHGCRRGKENILEVVQYLAEQGADMNTTDLEGETHLFPAVYNERLGNELMLSLVKSLIDKGTNVFVKQYKQHGERTFLHQMFRKQRNLTPSQLHDICQFLVRKGLVKMFDVPGGNNGETPLQWALENVRMSEETLTFLKDSGVNLNHIDGAGNNVLSSAIYGMKNYNFISLLIKHGANWRHVDNKKRSMLHDATRAVNVDAARVLLELGGTDVNSLDLEGNTPLHRTAQFGRFNVKEMTKLLIEYGAYTNAKNNQGKTPLSMVLGRNNVADKNEVVALLKGL